MKRAWFRAKDGTFYRNCPLISREMTRCRWPWRNRRFWQLAAEWDRAWQQGVIRKPTLGRGDIEAQPRPFREVYPDNPELWPLDDDRPG